MATAKRLQKLKSKYDEYPDDIFKDTRMSFGDHIDELRVRLIRALKWLMFFMLIGFALDAIGQALGNKQIGIGRPMVEVITDPVKEQVNDFYNRRIEAVWAKKMAEEVNSTPEEIQRIQQKLKDNDYNLTSLTSDERAKLRIAPEKMPVILPTAPLAEALNIPSEKVKKQEVQLDAQVIPARLTYLTVKGEGLLENKQYLSTMSVQEGFVVYFKVSLLCGIVLASPFIFYQFWAFVGAGLYPHEKRYIYVFFGPSLVLFIAGILLCQFWVLPGAVKALLAFNEWLGFDPDIRLKEWLSLAIILPLVFGISFQTPLVMVFLNRIGMFTAHDYLSKWRHACFFLALFAAIITPTPDAVTMCYLFIPMFGLYMAGIVVCYWFPAFAEEDEEAEAAEEVAV